MSSAAVKPILTLASWQYVGLDDTLGDPLAFPLFTTSSHSFRASSSECCHSNFRDLFMTGIYTLTSVNSSIMVMYITVLIPGDHGRSAICLCVYSNVVDRKIALSFLELIVLTMPKDLSDFSIILLNTFFLPFGLSGFI